MNSKYRSDITKAVIRSTKGHLFSVTFVKKDGSIRVMLCRTGVNKGVNGVGKPYNKDLPIFRVYDMQKMGWRTVNCDKVLSIRYAGQLITFSDA